MRSAETISRRYRRAATASALFVRLAAACALAAAISPSLAQLTDSNFATLTLNISGSNLLLRADFDTTNGAFTVVQAERPDALRLPACSCQISNQILDIGW